MENEVIREKLKQIIFAAEDWSEDDDGFSDPADFKTIIQLEAAKLVYITRGGGRHQGCIR